MTSTKKLKNVRKGDIVTLPGDPTVHHVVKTGKGFDTGWKKITYVVDPDYADDPDFHKTFTADGELEVSVSN